MEEQYEFTAEDHMKVSSGSWPTPRNASPSDNGGDDVEKSAFAFADPNNNHDDEDNDDAHSMGLGPNDISGYSSDGGFADETLKKYGGGGRLNWKCLLLGALLAIGLILGLSLGLTKDNRNGESSATSANPNNNGDTSGDDNDNTNNGGGDILDPDTPDTPLPTVSPVPEETDIPTVSPSAAPTVSPSVSPTASPSQSPTLSPSASPSGGPTTSPTGGPTTTPSASPSSSPTASPTASPSTLPSGSPTFSPTFSPSAFPTFSPSSVLVDIIPEIGDELPEAAQAWRQCITSEPMCYNRYNASADCLTNTDLCPESECNVDCNYILTKFCYNEADDTCQEPLKDCRNRDDICGEGEICVDSKSTQCAPRVCQNKVTQQCDTTKSCQTTADCGDDTETCVPNVLSFCDDRRRVCKDNTLTGPEACDTNAECTSKDDCRGDNVSCAVEFSEDCGIAV